jgi:glucan biosynthesis protein C
VNGHGVSLLDRIPYLDALRAAALLLGVLLHSALSFTPGAIEWPVTDAHSSRFLDGLVFWIHLFRMPLFFFLAGWFGARTLDARGPRGYTVARIRRVVAPLVVGWIILFPFILGSWLFAMKRTNPEQLPEIAVSLPVPKVVIGMYLRGMVAERFTLAHLWFLWDLALLGFLALAVTRMPGANAISGWIGARLGRPGGVLLLAIPITGVLFFESGWSGLFPNERALVPPHWPTLFAYACYFAIGWIASSDSEAFDRISAHRPIRLLVLLILSGVLYWMHGRLGSQEQTADLLHGWRRGLFSLSYAFLGWRWIFALIGMFRARVDTLAPWVRYLAGASYTVYLVHLPVAVVLQTIVFSRPAPWPVKYAIVVCGTMAASLAMYHWLVRPTFLENWLGSGKRKLPARAAA